MSQQKKLRRYVKKDLLLTWNTIYMERRIHLETENEEVRGNTITRDKWEICSPDQYGKYLSPPGEYLHGKTLEKRR